MIDRDAVANGPTGCASRCAAAPRPCPEPRRTPQGRRCSTRRARLRRCHRRLQPRNGPAVPASANPRRFASRVSAAGRRRDRTRPASEALAAISRCRMLCESFTLSPNMSTAPFLFGRGLPRHAGTPRMTPENHNSPGLQSEACTARAISSAEAAGMREAPVSGSRSQTIISSGRSRFTSDRARLGVTRRGRPRGPWPRSRQARRTRSGARWTHRRSLHSPPGRSDGGNRKPPRSVILPRVHVTPSRHDQSSDTGAATNLGPNDTTSVPVYNTTPRRKR